MMATAPRNTVASAGTATSVTGQTTGSDGGVILTHGLDGRVRLIYGSDGGVRLTHGSDGGVRLTHGPDGRVRRQGWANASRVAGVVRLRSSVLVCQFETRR